MVGALVFIEGVDVGKDVGFVGTELGCPEGTPVGCRDGFELG